MARIVIVGGGLAGLAAAAALGQSGFEVELLESRAFLGGRATSWPAANAEGEEGELVDNCQHVLLRCCVNLRDFYARLGVGDKIRFYREFYFLEPGGRMSVLKRGILPAPAHFYGSFAKLKFLSVADKFGIARALLALRRERHREDLDQITMLDWLLEKKQTQRAVERYWRQVLVSAINEDLDRMAASHGFQVFWLGMLAQATSYEMGIPDVPLRELYQQAAWNRIGGVQIHSRQSVSQIEIEAGAVQSVVTGNFRYQADHYVCALPFERVPAVLPELAAETAPFQHSPITGIHLWFDRPVTDLPHATLLDRTMQWMFNKSDGRYVQLVVSASRSLTEMSRADVISLAVKELSEFFPAAAGAKLLRAHVVKEIRATFSAAPGLESLRPPAATQWPNLSLAGDWTRSGWPATMEGAVRSGYLAAEDAAKALGMPQKYLLADLG